MSQVYIKVTIEHFQKLLDAVGGARSLLDDVHCYDTDVYKELGDVLEEIDYEVFLDE